MSHTLAATPLLHSPWIVGMVFVFFLLTMFSIGKQGTLRRQFQLAFDTHTTRTFVEPETGSWFSKPLLLMQTFLLEGFCIYLAIVHPEANYNFTLATVLWGDLLQCIALPLGWYLFQLISFNVLGYLFGAGSLLAILNRTYQAITYVSGALFLLLFLLQLVFRFEPEILIILLFVIFFMIQLLFVFNGIKIFFNGIVTLCCLFLYLCTLEIAPLFVLFQKLMA